MSRVNPIIFDKLKLEMSRNEVLDQAFLARIDRKWEGAIGERELQYFAPINLLLDHGLDNQKGAVQDDIRPGRPCTIFYLRCIKYNLLALLLAYIPVGPQENLLHQEELHAFLDHGDSAITRLHNNPSLFPSPEVQSSFFHDVCEICTLISAECIPLAEEIELHQSEFKKLSQEEVDNLLMPHRDPKRTLWQNYFHKNAPGSGVPAHLMPDGHCTQVLPVGACELILTWRCDRHAAMTEMGIVPENTSAPASNPTGALRIKNTISPGGNERVSYMAVNCLPSFPSNNILRLAYDAAPSHPARLSWLNESFTLLKRARAQADGGPVQPPRTRPWPGNMLRSCYVVQEKMPEGKGKEKEKETEEEEGEEGLSSEMVE